MHSPFPGMDPYLEQHWGDVHTRLIVYSGDQIRPQLPGHLKVRVEEKIAVQSDLEGLRSEGYYPDVRIVEHPAGRGAQPAAAGGVAVAEPVLVPVIREQATERSLQIIDTRSGNRIVTTIEFLSPANKVDADGRAAFLKKQRQLQLGGVNLVEIDLLREGRYALSAPLEAVPLRCRGPYRILVSRAINLQEVEMYPVPLRDRLPTIRIPLRPADEDVLLDLQSLIEAAYENGGYDDTDYGSDPQPPLESSDGAWAAALLKEAKRR